MAEQRFSNKKPPGRTAGGAPAAPPAIRRHRGRFGERLFRAALTAGGALVLIVVAGLLLSLVISSVPSLREYGPTFLTGTDWDPAAGRYGAFPFIAGTLITSFLALALSLPFSFALSVFLGEYFRKGVFSSVVRTMMELLAGIPSVIYGLAGVFFIIPLMQRIEAAFGFTPYGVGVLSAAVVLAVMIVPYSASLGKEVLELVPEELKEGAFALGATRAEVITRISIPYSLSGIMAGMTLALGRALGETIAVTMLIGNMNAVPANLFAPGQTIASLIANQFNEAGNEMHRSALLEMGLLLFVMTALVTLIGKYIIRKMSVEKSP